MRSGIPATLVLCAMLGVGGCGGDDAGQTDTTPTDARDAIETIPPDGPIGDLPQGNTGIAARYPNDLGIAADPDVIFADDFESYATPDELWGRWDNVYQMDQTRLATAAADVYAGLQSLEFTVPRRDAELSNSVDKGVAPERDVLFLRYYSKFDGGFDVVGSSHNGSVISAHYDVDGHATPGIPADGYNKFLAAFECWRGEVATPNPGDLNVYIYHPAQRSQWGDHFFPTGLVMPNTSLPFDFGPEFVARPDVIPELGRWYAYEFMVQANTVGRSDGRIACWVDGVLIADFPNLVFRATDTLTIDRFGLSLHVGSNTLALARKWYDNVVAATHYIGPLSH
jgi:hypothetical protein